MCQMLTLNDTPARRQSRVSVSETEILRAHERAAAHQTQKQRWQAGQAINGTAGRLDDQAPGGDGRLLQGACQAGWPYSQRLRPGKTRTRRRGRHRTLHPSWAGTPANRSCLTAGCPRPGRKDGSHETALGVRIRERPGVDRGVAFVPEDLGPKVCQPRREIPQVTVRKDGMYLEVTISHPSGIWPASRASTRPRGDRSIPRRRSNGSIVNRCFIPSSSASIESVPFRQMRSCAPAVYGDLPVGHFAPASIADSPNARPRRLGPGGSRMPRCAIPEINRRRL